MLHQPPTASLRLPLRQFLRLLALVPLLGLHGPTAAGALSDALQLARQHDPQFLQAVAERGVNRISAQAAGAAYYPQAQLSYNQNDSETKPRQTYTLSQPLISADRWATLKEREPREQLAEATYRMREQELSQRLLKAASELLRLHENLQFSQAKIAAMDRQSAAAARAFELGQGTVTDVRDAKVRLDQARAEMLLMEAQIGAAQRQLTAMTGVPAGAFVRSVPRVQRWLGLRSLDDYLQAAAEGHPQLQVAQANQRVAELGVMRADYAFLPVLSATYTVTSSAGRQTQYSGLQLSLPLQASSYYQMKGAAASASRALEQTRETQLRIRLDIQRLWELAGAGQRELAIRLEAIQSAQLNVEANEKSFKGGVRSQTDVLNSIQTLYQVQQDYVNAVLQLAENHLNLLLQAAVPVDDAVAQVQAILLPETANAAVATTRVAAKAPPPAPTASQAIMPSTLPATPSTSTVAAAAPIALPGQVKTSESEAMPVQASTRTSSKATTKAAKKLASKAAARAAARAEAKAAAKTAALAAAKAGTGGALRTASSGHVPVR